jgi:hypothetical protein
MMAEWLLLGKLLHSVYIRISERRKPQISLS